MLCLSLGSHVVGLGSSRLGSSGASCHAVLGLRSEIVNEFYVIFGKVTFPDHHDGIVSRGTEVIATRAEIRGIGRALVSVKCVEDVALAQIPHLDSRVSRGRQQVPSIRVE